MSDPVRLPDDPNFIHKMAEQFAASERKTAGRRPQLDGALAEANGNNGASVLHGSAIATDARFPLIDAAELLDHIEPPEYIADGLLEKDVTCGLIGPPESGKSLFVQHLGSCVATGRPFFGREVARGLVVYLCGEGYHGIARRLQAIEAHHKLGLANAAFVISKCGASFLSAMEVERIKVAIEAAEQRFGPMVLLIVDTLARFLAPGDRVRPRTWVRI